MAEEYSIANIYFKVNLKSKERRRVLQRTSRDRGFVDCQLKEVGGSHPSGLLFSEPNAHPAHLLVMSFGAWPGGGSAVLIPSMEGPKPVTALKGGPGKSSWKHSWGSLGGGLSG
ncbi:hypothetical protein VULLAG_LOCUS14858 [Vulpes lagopus]